MVRDGCAQRALDGCAEVRMRRSMDGRARRCREVATCRTRPIRQACRTRRPSRYARRHGRMPVTATPCSMLWAGCWRVMPFTAPSAGCWWQDGGGWGGQHACRGHRRMSCDSTRALPLRHRHAYSRHRPTVLSSSLGQRAPAVRHAPVLMHLFVIGRTAPSVKSFQHTTVWAHASTSPACAKGYLCGGDGPEATRRGGQRPGVPCMPLRRVWRVSASPLISPGLHCPSLRCRMA